MSNPYPDPYPQTYPPVKFGPTPQENTLGLVGFIVSLLGLFICLAAPVGLILSLLGLRREPKTLAIVGTIIGGLTTLLYVAILAVYGAALAACIGIGVAAQPMLQTMASLQDARKQIEDAMGPDGVYPEAAEGNWLIAGKTDYWKTQLRYEPTEGGFVIRSAGPDQQFDTLDDLTVDDFGTPAGMEQPSESLIPNLEEEFSPAKPEVEPERQPPDGGESTESK